MNEPLIFWIDLFCGVNNSGYCECEFPLVRTGERCEYCGACGLEIDSVEWED